MRRTLIAVLFLVLVINYVDRASCQTNSTNTTGTNTTATNSTTNTTTNSTTNTTGTNTTTNTTGGANTNTNTSTGTTTVNNFAFFKANGTLLTAVNTYSSQKVSAGKSLYVYFKMTAASQPNATVYVLPKDVGSVYSGGFPLKLSVITQAPDTAGTGATGNPSLVTSSSYDGNALSGFATFSADTWLMAQIDNPSTADIDVMVNFLVASYKILSPMGTIQNTRKNVASSSFSSAWDIYEMYIPTTNVKVLTRLFNCQGASNMFYVTTIALAQSIAATATTQSSSVIPNNTFETTYSAATTVYIVVNPYSGSTQSDGTVSVSYALDASMYNASTIIPASNFVAGGNGYISYTRDSDTSVKFSWSPVVSASSDYASPISNPTVTYSLYVATTQDNFTTLLYCGPVSGSDQSNSTTSTTQTITLNPSNQYYVGVVGRVSNYAFTTYQNNIPELYAPYQPTSYNYIKPSSSDSNPAGLGVTVFFLVLLIIIVIILAIVLYTKYKAKKNGELGGGTSGPSRAAATTATAAAATKTSGAKGTTSPPQSAMPVLPKTEPPKKADVKYAPPPPPEPIKVDQLKDDHGLQQVDHHYEVDQQVPDNYDYNPGNEYQGEEYQGGGGNQDDYNPDAYAGQEQGQGEYEQPNDQHEVSPDNDHHGHEH